MVIRLGWDMEVYPISGESETVRAGGNVAITTFALGRNVCVCTCTRVCPPRPLGAWDPLFPFWKLAL